MNPSVKKLSDKRDAIKASMRSLVDLAEREDRDLTDQEQESFDAYKGEVSELETRINLLRTSQIVFFVLGSGLAAFCFRFDSFLGFLLPAAVTMLSIALSFYKK